MKKIIYRTIVTTIVLFFFIIIYLSTVGIKTDKFNSKIVSQIKNIEPSIDLKINDVSARLNLFNLTINAKTFGTDLIYKNKTIKIENIKSKISLKSIINNQFAISEISISTKSLLIKDLINFIRLLKNDPKLYMAEQFIGKGYIVADIKLDFDKFGKVKNNFRIKGFVNDGQISFLKKKLSKLNFTFEIIDNEFKLNDIKLLLNNKSINIPELTAVKQKDQFLVSGKIDSKNLSLQKEDIENFINNDFLKFNVKEIIFSSKSEFSFKIDKNFKIKNLNFNSKIDLDHLKIDNFLKLKDNFPKIKKNLLLKNQKIEIDYDKSKTEITGSGLIFLQEKSDIIEYKITDIKKELIFDINLKISKNPFIIDLLNYKKIEKSILNLNFKGNYNKKKLFFNRILLSENENNLSIKDFEFTKNFKIKEIKNIKFDYFDKDNIKNSLQFEKFNKDYKLSGGSFNIDKIITELLKSKEASKKYFLNNDFKVLLDIKKIYFDKNNFTKNLKGFFLFNDNKLTELNLVSEFLNKEKIRLTIKTTENGEKITTLFSDEAKPLVDRYKFIKGFNEGKLDFYSIKKNEESKSTLKIYDFKLKELPALTKILTLASLQGIADLLSGEGIRFDEFEMNFTNKKDLMTVNEIYAIGPAISILMEGYIEKDNLISLRGTLVPATTINKTISSIPLLGDILVGKKAGEGVFGVSFKIKGPPKKLETTVNPVKTLTPRFITRTLEKIKKN